MSNECRYCQVDLLPDARFCTKCGLPTADACPTCQAEIPLACAECGTCHVPLVHCPGCGRAYTVQHIHCENVDWNCEGTLLVEPCPSWAGQHAGVARTRSAPHPGALALGSLGEPAWVFEDERMPMLDVVMAYGRVYAWTPEWLLAFPTDMRSAGPPGPVTAADARVRRSERLAAAGRGHGVPAEMTVAWGQVLVLATRAGQGPRVHCFQADDVENGVTLDVEAPWSALPLPGGCMVWTRERGGPSEAHWIELGATAPDRSVEVPAVPEPSHAPAAVHLGVEGAQVLYRGDDESLIHLRPPGLEPRVLLQSPAGHRLGPVTTVGDCAFVLGGAGEVTRIHRVDLRSLAHDTSELAVGSDLVLRGAGGRRLLYLPGARAWAPVRFDPWPARLEPNAMNRPGNEDLLQDIALEGSGPPEILALTRERGRLELRLLGAREESLGLLDGNEARFALAGPWLLAWTEGRPRLQAWKWA